MTKCQHKFILLQTTTTTTAHCKAYLFKQWRGTGFIIYLKQSQKFLIHKCFDCTLWIYYPFCHIFKPTSDTDSVTEASCNFICETTTDWLFPRTLRAKIVLSIPPIHGFASMEYKLAKTKQNNKWSADKSISDILNRICCSQFSPCAVHAIMSTLWF